MASNEGQQRTSFATFVGQQVIKSLTDAEINELMHDPEKLAAYTARLKSPPMPKGSKAPLHVGTPPRTIDFHRPDGGITKAVPLASDQSVELPMLPSLNGPNSDKSVESMRQNPHRKGGAELPDHLVD